MRKRPSIVRLCALFSILFLILIYLVLYFFPTVKSINRLKRETKDIYSKIEEFGKIETNFSFPDEREQHYFLGAGREFKSKIPKIRGKGDYIDLLAAISDYLVNRARKDGIPDPGIKPGADQEGITVEGNLKYRTVILSFKGNLRSGLLFINHIPWGDFYLVPGTITLTRGDSFPVFLLTVKIYYFAGKSASSGGKQGKSVDEGLTIDVDAGILTDKVYHNIPGESRKRELQGDFGSI